MPNVTHTRREWWQLSDAATLQGDGALSARIMILAGSGGVEGEALTLPATAAEQARLSGAEARLRRRERPGRP
jgi:hypothetical protein